MNYAFATEYTIGNIGIQPYVFLFLSLLATSTSDSLRSYNFNGHLTHQPCKLKYLCEVFDTAHREAGEKSIGTARPGILVCY